MRAAASSALMMRLFKLEFRTREVVATAEDDIRHLSNGEDSGALTATIGTGIGVVSEAGHKWTRQERRCAGAGAKKTRSAPTPGLLSRDRADHGLRAIGETASRLGLTPSRGTCHRLRHLNLGGLAANTTSIAR